MVTVAAAAAGRVVLSLGVAVSVAVGGSLGAGRSRRPTGAVAALLHGITHVGGAAAVAIVFLPEAALVPSPMFVLLLLTRARGMAAAVTVATLVSPAILSVRVTRRGS
jgi:hypothetical protein